jgi:DNA-nicking Smr family endonuclease
MTKRQMHKPFRHLKKLLQAHDVQLEALPVVRIVADEQAPVSPQHEAYLFREAMKGVQPLSRPKTAPCSPCRPKPANRLSEDELVVHQLRGLVATGRGFRVADTPEYIEGRNEGVPREVTRRLHAGAFAVQAKIDLHGLDVAQARAAVERLLDRAIRHGLRTVLIIHGRGLSSPGRPVLKSRLVGWLEHSAWRKWVLAYTSARICDGGAGATYVLLRHRPAAKRTHRRPSS